MAAWLDSWMAGAGDDSEVRTAFRGGLMMRRRSVKPAQVSKCPARGCRGPAADVFVACTRIRNKLVHCVSAVRLQAINNSGAGAGAPVAPTHMWCATPPSLEHKGSASSLLNMQSAHRMQRPTLPAQAIVIQIPQCTRLCISQLCMHHVTPTTTAESVELASLPMRSTRPLTE